MIFASRPLIRIVVTVWIWMPDGLVLWMQTQNGIHTSLVCAMACCLSERMMQGEHKSWKSVDFKIQIFQAWKVIVSVTHELLHLA